MRRDTGLGNCPACGSTTIVMLSRPPTFKQFLRYPSRSLLINKDLVCSDCGEKWTLESAEASDPWAAPSARKPEVDGDPIDEDALDEIWARWSQPQE